jgi:hypothetical protein
MKKINLKLGLVKKKLPFLVAFLYLLPVTLLFSQGTDPGDVGNNTIENPVNINSIDALLNAILTFVVRLGTPIVTIAIIYVGFKFVAARGNTSKLEEAKSNLWYVVIGASIILGAFVLRTVITGTVEQLEGGL